MAPASGVSRASKRNAPSCSLQLRRYRLLWMASYRPTSSFAAADRTLRHSSSAQSGHRFSQYPANGLRTRGRPKRPKRSPLLGSRTSSPPGRPQPYRGAAPAASPSQVSLLPVPRWPRWPWPPSGPRSGLLAFATSSVSASRPESRTRIAAHVFSNAVTSTSKHSASFAPGSSR